MGSIIWWEVEMKFFFSSKLHQYLIKQIAAEDKEQAL